MYMDTHSDFASFWKAQGALIYDLVAPYLSFPTSVAVVERSFNLASFVDTKSRKKNEPLLLENSMMYCNGDVEGQFSKSVL